MNTAAVVFGEDDAVEMGKREFYQANRMRHGYCCLKSLWAKGLNWVAED
jgi:hypothetical protein